VPFEQARLFAYCRKVPGTARLVSPAGQFLDSSVDDGRDVAVAAHLRDEPTSCRLAAFVSRARPERVGHAPDDGVLVGHPVQRRVGEDGVERLARVVLGDIGPLERKAGVLFAGLGDHLGGLVDADHVTFVADRRCDFGREVTRPAAQVENPVAGLRVGRPTTLAPISWTNAWSPS